MCAFTPVDSIVLANYSAYAESLAIVPAGIAAVSEIAQNTVTRNNYAERIFPITAYG